MVTSTLHVSNERWGKNIRIHFLHIGKTGGSALKQGLKTCPDCQNIMFHGHDVTLRDVPSGERVIFVVREPVARFISGFNSRLRKGRPRNNMEWSEAEAQTFARFATPRALADALTSSDPDAREAAEVGLKSVRHPARHLTHWLESVAYLNSRREDILFIGRTEVLDADFVLLGQRLGLSGTPILPSDTIGRHATPPGLDRELSPQGATAIASWYERDTPLYEACLAIRASILENSHRG